MIQLSEEAAQEIAAALQHGAMSNHHKHCGHWHARACSCHVEKCRRAATLLPVKSH